MSYYKLAWLDERLFDNDCEEIKKFWKRQNKNIYFNEDECIININKKDVIDVQIETIKLVKELGLDVWSLIKSEVILTEEVRL